MVFNIRNVPRISILNESGPSTEPGGTPEGITSQDL